MAKLRTRSEIVDEVTNISSEIALEADDQWLGGALYALCWVLKKVDISPSEHTNGQAMRAREE